MPASPAASTEACLVFRVLPLSQAMSVDPELSLVCVLQVGSLVILLTNELSRTHPGLNAGALGKVVQLPQQQAWHGGSSNDLVLDQVRSAAHSLSGALPEGCVP
jgi:hypothetical protein